MKIYLAIDFFFENWNRPHKGRLWMAILPYVPNTRSLAKWVDDVSSNGSRANYELFSAATSLTNPDAFVPVTLPDDTDFQVSLPGAEPILVKRTKNFIVTDPQGFRQLNTEPVLTPIDETKETDELQVGEREVSYVKSLIKQIQVMKADANDRDKPDDLAVWLKFAFEIGQVRRFNGEVMSSFGPYMSTMHPDDPRFDESEESDDKILRATNLHCLAGHVVELPNNLELLNAVGQVEIEFLVKSECHQTLSLNHDADSGKAVRAFFSSIKQRFSPPDLSMSWLEEFKRRVYALPTAQLFPLQPLGERVVLYRRPRGAEGSKQALTDISLDHLQRISIRYGLGIDENGQSEPHPSSPNSISLRQVSTFDLSCKPFKSYPLPTKGESPLPGYVMELLPQPHDLKRWQEFIKELYDQGDSDIPRLQLWRDDGEGAFRKLNPDWVKLFRLPWEPRNAPSVLMYARENCSGLLIALSSADNRRSFELDLKGLDSQVDPFGARWETDIPADAGEFLFDALEVDSDLSELDTQKLIVAAYSDNEYQFELAQSARRLESVARVRIQRAGHADKPDDTSAEQEYQEDFINHNTANFVETWSGQRWLLTASSENAADYSELSDDEILYTFQFRFTSPTSARPAMDDVRAFYQDLYAKLGKSRSIEMSLEHTYGTLIPMVPKQEMRTCLDEPILHPSDVSEDVNGEKVALVEVSYLKQNSQERLALVFDKRLLDRDWVDDQAENNILGRDSLLKSHVEAWQSVSELAHAAKLLAVCQAYHFDFTVALNSEAQSVGEGLIPIGEALEFDITNEVNAELRHWLSEGVGDVGTTWEVALPISSKPIWKSSHVIRCYLVIERDSSLHPEQGPHWQLVAHKSALPKGGVESLVGRDGYVVDSAPEGTRILFEQWIDSLGSTSAYLNPSNLDAGDRDSIERYRGILNRGPADADAPADRDASSWIIPEGKRESDGLAGLTVVPLGFRPFNRTDLLGDTTGLQIRTYFRILQSAISLASENWAKNWNSKQWLEFFKRFDRQTEAGKNFWTIYDELCGRVAALLHPVPDTRPADGTDTPINCNVIKAALAIKNDTPIKRAIRKRFQLRFAQSPSVFAVNKALAYIRVSGPKPGIVAPADFYSLKIGKLIVPNRSSDAYPAVRDSYSASFDRGINLKSDRTWYGFLEELNDVIYDNEYQIESVQMRSVEDLLEGKPGSMKLADNEIHVPAQSPQQMLPSASAPFIYLPSRRLVQQPINVATGIFDLAQSSESFELAFRLNETRDFNAFLLGMAEAKSDEFATVKRIASSSQMERSKNIDDRVVSYVFSIRGDEEFDEDWLNGLANDAFLLRVGEEALPTGKVVQAEETLDTPKVVVQSFKLLQQPEIALNASGLDNLLKSATVQYVSDAIGNRMSPVKEPKEFFLKFHVKDDGNGRAAVEFQRGPSAVNGRGIQIHIFQAGDEDSAETLYFWINLELPVWHDTYTTLQQSRNFGSAERRFEPEFGMLSLAETSGMQPRETLVYSAKNRNYVSLDQVHYSAQSFLKTLLIQKTGLVTEIGERDQKLVFNVNITLSEVIAPSFPSQRPGEEQGIKSTEIGVFPLNSIRIRNEQEDATSWRKDRSSKFWFPSPGGRMRVDVEWRYPETNDILFRIEGVEVR